jgi:predicted esterase
MMTTLFMSLAVASILSFLVAHQSQAQQVVSHYNSQNLPALKDPANTIVLIHNHGSIADRQADACDMSKLNVASSGIPHLFHELHGRTIAGKTISVEGFCSTQRGDYDADTKTGELKVVKRARAIAARAKAYAELGVPAKQIFLAGQSAGAWASLMVKAQTPEAVNSVIAFSAAFAGRWKARNATWQAIRDDRVRELQKAGRLDALVYSIQNDEYELPEHHAFLDGIPGIERIVLSDQKVENVACDSKTSSHALLFNTCVYSTQVKRIEAYIEKRLAAGN